MESAKATERYTCMWKLQQIVIMGKSWEKFKLWVKVAKTGHVDASCKKL